MMMMMMMMTMIIILVINVQNHQCLRLMVGFSRQGFPAKQVKKTTLPGLLVNENHMILSSSSSSSSSSVLCPLTKMTSRHNNVKSSR